MTGGSNKSDRQLRKRKTTELATEVEDPACNCVTCGLEVAESDADGAIACDVCDGWCHAV